MFLSRFANEIYQTGILFGSFVSILSAFINASIFVKELLKIASSLFRRKLCSIRSVAVFENVCFVDILGFQLTS